MTYIDRDKLIKILKHRYTEMWESNDISLADAMSENGTIQDIITGLPNADVEEVHYGEWVYCGSDVRRCSHCGHEVTVAQADLYKGCPICRAKMKGR